ncbi:MAG: SMC family ATPase [Spirochaetaceae bacterium]|nr:SMC family ATPase [Spirochaetaceae bacterium]
MRPIQLTVEGLTCFKEKQEIDFSSLDLFAISGPTGAGKSTLLDAILFALYGEVPRVSKQDLKEMISAARERVSVRFDFAVGKRRFRVARALRRKGAAAVRLEEHDGTDFNTVLADQVRPASAEVTRLLGLDVDAFTQAVILPQGEFAKFLKADPRKRREMLRTLLRLDVYERMRQAAQDTSTRKKHGLDALEQRLREEYGGVSAAALSALQGELQQAATKLEERRKESEAAESRLIEIRHRHAKTVDLAKSEARLAELHGITPQIEEARSELDAARRAAALVPLIEEADRAGQEADHARNAAQEARHANEAAGCVHEERERELANAREQAEEIPALRDRLANLDRILGRLPELTRLETEVGRRRTRIEQLDQELEQGRERLEQLADEATRQQASVGTARAELDAIGYDADLDAALDKVRETATKLAIARRQLQDAKPEQERRRKTLDGLAVEVERLTGQARDRDDALHDAEQAVEAAEEALHAAHRQDAANDLRGSLAAGAPCPVCAQLVADPPAADLHPDVAAARSGRDEASTTLRRARDDAQDARNALVGTQGDVRAAQEALTEADSTTDKARADIRQLTADIREAIGGSVPVDDDAVVAWFQERIETTATARSSFEDAQGRLETAELHLTDLGRSEQTTHGELDRMRSERRERIEEVTADEERLRAVQAEIAGVTQSTDPGQERTDLSSRIDDLEAGHREALSAEAEARRELATTQQAREDRERAAGDADREAAARIEQRDRHVAQARFDSVGDVRNAVRDETAQARLSESVAGHERDLHATGLRVRDLQNDLGAERISVEQLDDASANDRRIKGEVEELVTRNAHLGQQVETMTERLARAQALHEQLRAMRDDHRLFSGLATDLRSDRFQAYVLEDSFTKLVQGASDRLFTLSGERYSLTFQEDQILVVDHDNADETRISDTLSGGETFLTSLSLALELSRQVQDAAGAVNLDSLFIDEGFGTLDPDTLATVSETIQGLQVAGRMVGVITHIPDLRSEFSQQIQVTRHQGSSTVRVIRDL